MRDQLLISSFHNTRSARAGRWLLGTTILLYFKCSDSFCCYSLWSLSVNCMPMRAILLQCLLPCNIRKKLESRSCGFFNLLFVPNNARQLYTLYIVYLHAQVVHCLSYTEPNWNTFLAQFNNNSFSL